MEKKMVYYSALHWAKKAEKSAEKCEQIQEDLDASGLDLSKYAKKSEVVHRTGDETIDGIKTFNNTVLSYNPLNAFNSLNKNITRGTAPTSKQEGFLTRTSDKYNTNLAGFYYTHTIENENSLSMLVYDPTKSSGYDQAFLRLGYGGNGAWSETVKPANNGSQSSANIATVGWVNDPSASLNVVHRTGDETIDGIKAFKQGIVGTFQNYYAYSGSTNDKPWKKVMEITLSGTYNTITIPFIITNTVANERGSTLGNLKFRTADVAGTLTTSQTGIYFNILPTWFDKFEFKILYKNNYPESNKVLAEFWVRVPHTYSGVCITVLDEMSGGMTKLGKNTRKWYDNTQEYAELPSNYEQIDVIVDNSNTNTPSMTSNSRAIATTEWYNKKNKVVSALPSSPTEGVFYYITE